MPNGNQDNILNKYGITPIGKVETGIPATIPTEQMGDDPILSKYGIVPVKPIEAAPVPEIDDPVLKKYGITPIVKPETISTAIPNIPTGIQERKSGVLSSIWHFAIDPKYNDVVKGLGLPDWAQYTGWLGKQAEEMFRAPVEATFGESAGKVAGLAAWPLQFTEELAYSQTAPLFLLLSVAPFLGVGGAAGKVALRGITAGAADEETIAALGKQAIAGAARLFSEDEISTITRGAQIASKAVSLGKDVNQALVAEGINPALVKTGLHHLRIMGLCAADLYNRGMIVNGMGAMLRKADVSLLKADKVSKGVQALMDLGFSANMIYGAYLQVPGFTEALSEGNYTEATKMALNMAGYTGLGLLGINRTKNHVLTEVGALSDKFGIGFRPSEEAQKLRPINGRWNEKITRANRTAELFNIDNNKYFKDLNPEGRWSARVLLEAGMDKDTVIKRLNLLKANAGRLSAEERTKLLPPDEMHDPNTRGVQVPILKSVDSMLKETSGSLDIKEGMKPEIKAEAQRNIDTAIKRLREGKPVDPIAVYRDENGKIIGMRGRYRLQAYKDLGFKEIPVLEMIRTDIKPDFSSITEELDQRYLELADRHLLQQKYTPEEIDRLLRIYEKAANPTDRIKELASLAKKEFNTELFNAEQHDVHINAIEDYITNMWQKEADNPATNRLLHEINNYSEFRMNASMLRHRTFANAFEGEMLGRKLKITDPIELISNYKARIGELIAGREALVEMMDHGLRHSSGRPFIAYGGAGEVQDGIAYIDSRRVRNIAIAKKEIEARKADGSLERAIRNGDIIERYPKPALSKDTLPEIGKPPTRVAGPEIDKFRTNLKEKFGKGLSNEQIEYGLALYNARARMKGVSLNDYLKGRLAGIEKGAEEHLKKLPETERPFIKGMVEFQADGRAIMRGMASADFSTFIHETFHIFRRDLDPDSLKILEDWVGVKDGKWTSDNEEMVSRAGETYISKGISPIPELETVFAKFKQWMKDIYEHMISSPMRDILPDNVTNVWDKFFGKEAEREARKAIGPEALFQRQEPWYFSQVRRTIETSPQTSWTPEQFKAWLSKQPGVKAEELKWLDLDSFLQGKTKIFKTDATAFLDQNAIRIEEIGKGIGRGLGLSKDEFSQNEYGKPYAQLEPYQQNYVNSIFEHEGDLPAGARTKFSKWTLEGPKENYREILLTFPNPKQIRWDELNRQLNEIAERPAAEHAKHPEWQAEWDRINAERKALIPIEEPYRGPHWEEPNVLGHIRLDDRTDTFGKRALFIEEIQSDWQQAARQRVQDVKRMESIESEIKSLESQLKDLRTKGSETFTERGPIVGKIEDLKHEYNNISYRTKETPQAPFRDWHELLMKRILRLAAEGGYDKVAWTTGEQQADRYDLSKQLNSITWFPNTKILEAYDKNNNLVIQETRIEEHELPNYIGKDAANKLTTAKEDMGAKRISGLDLKVGGEWAKNLYDKMIPEFLNKYGKKWGTKTEDTQLGGLGEGYRIINEPGTWRGRHIYDNKEEAQARIDEMNATYGRQYYKMETISKLDRLPVHSINITPEMSKSVMEGQPLFQKTADIQTKVGTPDNPPPKEPLQAELQRPKDDPVYLYNTHDYMTVDHPAFRHWNWAAYAPDGTPILVKGDVRVHPDVYKYITRMFGLEKSQLREIAPARAMLRLGTQFKQTLLSLSPFHITQLGLRSIMSGVIPRLVKWDLATDPELSMLVEQSMTIGHRFRAESDFSEGLAASGTRSILLKKIPGIRDVQNWIQEFTFDRLMPSLKAMVGKELLRQWKERFAKNPQLYEKYLMQHPDFSGLDPLHAAARAAAIETNERFGGLNYHDMGRAVGTQDFFRMVTLAPDWLESEVRLVKRLFDPTGGKILRRDMTYMVAGMWVTARAMNMLIDKGNSHPEAPFGVVTEDEEGHKKVWSMRTLPGDMFHMAEDPIGFMRGRASPTMRMASTLYTGRDAMGRKLTPWQQTADLVRNVMPIPLQYGARAITGELPSDIATPQAMARAGGFMVAPLRSEAEQKAMQLVSSKTESGTVDAADLRKHQLMLEYEDQLRSGEISRQDLYQMVEDGHIASAEAKRIAQEVLKTEAMKPGLARLYLQCSRLSLRDFLQVWEVMTNSEKASLTPILTKKKNDYRKKALKIMTPDERRADPTYQWILQTFPGSAPWGEEE